MSVKVFVDSTVLLYAKDRAAPLKLGQAQIWLESLAAEKAVLVSLQVLREFYNVVTKPSKQFRLSPAAARQELEYLYQWLPDFPIDDRFDDAWAIQDRYGFSWFDSLLLAAAIHAGCIAYISEDLQDGQLVEGMVVINPFANDAHKMLKALRAEFG